MIFQLLKHKRLVVRYNDFLKGLTLQTERNNYSNNNQVWSEKYYFDEIINPENTPAAEVITTTTVANNNNIDTFDNSSDDDAQMERENLALQMLSPTISMRSNSSNASNLYSPGDTLGAK